MNSNIAMKLPTLAPSLLSLYALACLTSMAAIELFSSLVLLIFIIQCGFNIKKVKDALPNSNILILLSGYFIFSIISYTMGEFDLRQFAKLRWILIFLALVFLLKQVSLDFLKRFVNRAGGFLIIVGLYAIFQYFTGIDFFRSENIEMTDSGAYRARGFLGSPMSFGHSLAILVSFMAPFYFVPTAKGKQWLRLSGILGITAVLVTMTRGAWLAIIPGFTLASLQLGALRTGIIGLIGSSLAGLFIYSNEALQDRISSLLVSGHNYNSGRWQIWNAHWNIFKDNPWLGVGPNMNVPLAPTYLAKLGAPAEIIAPCHAHNVYLQFLAGSGVVGSAFILGFFALICLYAYRSYKSTAGFEKQLNLGLICALMALLVGGLTECTFQDSETKALIIFIFALVIRNYDLPYKKILTSNIAAS